MSRCFPFPPPGYEKKITVDDTVLLKEEKHKDKRHKKDKEKRDRDKYRSREKNKEKEHKEKCKDKDRHRRNKQQDQISNEKIIGEQGYSGAENLGQKSLQNNGIRDYKYVQELARRIGEADSAAGSQMVQKIDAAKKRKAEQLAVPAENTNGNHTEEKGKLKDEMGDGRRFNGCRDQFEARCLENANGENFFGMDRKRFDGISASKESSLEQHLDGKDKKKSKESSKSDKQKGRHQEKTRMPVDERWGKEKKKEEKTKEVKEPSNGHLKLKENSVRLKESGKDSVDSGNFKPPGSLKSSSNSFVDKGNVGRHEDIELNGFLHGNGFQSNEFPRPASSHSVVENGKKLELSAFRLTSEKQGPVHIEGVDVKEHQINGVIKDQGPGVCSTRSSSGVLAVHSNGDTSAKPPHPDSKYLSQIFDVPKVEWSDFDDQKWLFSSGHPPSKKPKVACNLVDRTPQVWADALKIDSADITALPYVIPY